MYSVHSDGEYRVESRARAATIIAVSIVIALVRIAGVKHEAFQAIAHLWVGGLSGAWFVDRTKLYGWSVVALSVVEVACFLVGLL